MWQKRQLKNSEGGQEEGEATEERLGGEFQSVKSPSPRRLEIPH